jgi:hypothetical protein
MVTAVRGIVLLVSALGVQAAPSPRTIGHPPYCPAHPAAASHNAVRDPQLAATRNDQIARRGQRAWGSTLPGSSLPPMCSVVKRG